MRLVAAQGLVWASPPIPGVPLMRVLYALAQELRWLEVRMPTGSLLVCSDEFQIFSSCVKI